MGDYNTCTEDCHPNACIWQHRKHGKCPWYRQVEPPAKPERELSEWEKGWADWAKKEARKCRTV